MSDLREALSDPRKYVLYWCSINNVTVDAKGNLVDPNHRNTKQLMNTSWLDYISDANAFNVIESQKASNLRANIKRFKDTDLQRAFEELQHQQMAFLLSEKVDELKSNKEDLEPVREFTRAVVGKDCEVTTAVIAHWIWLIKRKMSNKPVKHHVMPIFFGKQGSGKSMAVTKLISPVADYRLDLSVTQMVDERYAETMSQNYVMVFDEMQGAARTDIDSLKRQITTEYNSFRPMRTTMTTRVKQNCSFIGTTNRPINQQIIDNDMRRFYEIKTLDKLNWEKVNSIDYLALWKGVDEHKVDGYTKEVFEKLTEKQQELSSKTQFEEFCEEFSITEFNNKGDNKEIPTSDVYECYVNWAKMSNFKVFNKTIFGKSMASLGYESKLVTRSGSTYRVYSLNKSSSVVKPLGAF